MELYEFGIFCGGPSFYRWDKKLSYRAQQRLNPTQRIDYARDRSRAGFACSRRGRRNRRR